MFNSRKMFLIAMVLTSSKSFAGFFPDEAVQGLRKGYSKEELSLLDKDLDYIRQLVFTGKTAPKNRKPVYIATAGAPGARKSTILESYLNTKKEFENTVYVDPDQRALKFMGNTYYSRALSNYKISQASEYKEAQKAAYDHWRAGSNFITNTLFSEAVAGGFDIAHGTTLTGVHSPTLLKKLRDAGYQITIVLCSAEDESRIDTVRYRSEVQGFYQTDPLDVKEKALLFPQRLVDYFSNANELWLHWSDKLTSPLEATAYISLKDKKGQIFSQMLYEKFNKKLDSDASKQAPVKSWSTVIQDFGIKFAKKSNSEIG